MLEKSTFEILPTRSSKFASNEPAQDVTIFAHNHQRLNQVREEFSLLWTVSPNDKGDRFLPVGTLSFSQNRLRRLFTTVVHMELRLWACPKVAPQQRAWLLKDVFFKIFHEVECLLSLFQQGNPHSNKRIILSSNNNTCRCWQPSCKALAVILHSQDIMGAQRQSLGLEKKPDNIHNVQKSSQRDQVV